MDIGKCKYTFNENHPDGGGWDSECGLIEDLNRTEEDLLKDWITCPCGGVIEVSPTL